LTISGSTLYGTTGQGGSNGGGTIFKVNADGTGYTELHSFVGLDSGGVVYAPQAAPVLSGSTLYGMAAGDSPGYGAIYRVGTDGTGFGLVHTFTGGVGDGAAPQGPLIQSGSTLYGMSELGGTANAGTVYKVNTDGTGFTILHSFTGGAGDGSSPIGGLLQVGSTLYGMASGVSNTATTIFKVNTDGTGFTVLHSFTGTDGFGVPLYGSLIQSGSSLYGMTPFGGAAGGEGTIFKINTDGSLFTVLHTFTGGPNDAGAGGGAYSVLDSLLLSGSNLYSAGLGGGTPGTNGPGTIFRIGTDGTGFGLLYVFPQFGNMGAGPNGSLVQSGSMLFGLTQGEGAYGQGMLYSFTVPVPEPSSLLLVAAAGPLAWLARRRRRPAAG
jgi:uncharacterized repeat protein (TIGR03803 family)